MNLAIGECGLDYNRMFSPKESQIFAFESQIKLAQKLNKKLYLHCRDAYHDFIQIIKKYKYYNGLIHCFTGTLPEAIELTTLGFKLGITGFILDQRRNEHLLKVISHPDILLDMLVIETDAPFMQITKGLDSTPSDLWKVLEKIAELKRLSLDIVGTTIYDTSLKFLL